MSFLAADRLILKRLHLVRPTETKETEVSKVTVDISISLDGFVAGPNPTLEEPLGEGGERLHEWVVATRPWRESHGLSGGDTGIDADVMAESLGKVGGTVMGRRMFSGGAGPWADDPNADGWWGEDPPFHHPVFVLTHHERDPVAKQGGTTFTFVTGGIEAALEQAHAAAGDKDVAVAGGANAIQQYLNAGLICRSTLPRCCSVEASGCSMMCRRRRSDSNTRA
jgi:dihydrofolate reductase